MASPRGHGQSAGATAKPKAVDDAKKSDREKKKNRRKTATVIRASDNPPGDAAAAGTDSLAARMGFSFGDASLRDISKKMAELNIDPTKPGQPSSGSTSPRGGSGGAAAELAKEHAKLKDMYTSERSKRKEAEEKSESLTKQLEESQKLADELQKRLATLEDVIASQKASILQLEDAKQALELDVKRANRETSDHKAQAEKAERKAKAYEDDYKQQSEKVKDLTAKATHLESLIKVENLVAERLESKKIKEVRLLSPNLMRCLANAFSFCSWRRRLNLSKRMCRTRLTCAN
jgi:myosin heavy subunit